MTTTTNKKYLYVLVIALVLFIAVGYAILNSNLKINGTTKISKSAWDVHFENVTPSNRGVTPTSNPTIDSSRTGINFAVNLTNLGDFYEFYVDVVNYGNFDAKLESINTTNLTDEQKKYLDLEISYSDGAAINIGDTIRSLKKDTIKIMVQYKTDPLILPETTTMDFNVSLVFVQDDGTGEDRSGNVLYNVLKDNAVMDNIASEFVTSETGINLGEISSDTNGKGVYTLSTTANNANPIYYYRGAVDNNNVLFGGYCWKMIRTTDTGGIKMIYNGKPTNGVCNATGVDTTIGKSNFNEQYDQYNDIKYAGYTYDDGSGNQVDSTAKSFIDTWYENNLIDYADFLEDAPFYNEKDLIDNGTNFRQLSPYVRVCGKMNNIPCDSQSTAIQLGAKNTEDIYTVSNSNGNGLLQYPISSITIDEVLLAGGRVKIGDTNDYEKGVNKDFYLCSGELYFIFSLSGTERLVKTMFMYANGILNLSDTIGNIRSIRPVISLKSGITYTSGDGTVSEPYQITKAEKFNSKSLYQMMNYNSIKDNVASEYVTGTNKDGVPGIHFGKISSNSNGKGIYELTQTKEDGETIYYYRGNVKNNNVEFGGFCWKIIRTSSTKGVKLIYNGLKQEDGCTATVTAASIGSSRYHENYNDIKYVGYTYLDGSTQKNSTIKTFIDTWYSSNLNSYTKYLEDIPFYNERDNVTSSSDSSVKYFAPRVRIYGSSSSTSSTTNTTIKLGAANASDKYTVSSSLGNGYLQYPVGLITSDEVIMAGGQGVGKSNSSYYLYTNSSYWTISPNYWNGICAFVDSVYGSGDLYSNGVNSGYHVRPVVSLKPGTVYTTGDGTVGNPYVIATE